MEQSGRTAKRRLDQLLTRIQACDQESASSANRWASKSYIVMSDGPGLALAYIPVLWHMLQQPANVSERLDQGGLVNLTLQTALLGEAVLCLLIIRFISCKNAVPEHAANTRHLASQPLPVSLMLSQIQK